MAGFSNYLSRKLLDQVWGGTDYAEPATMYVGLSTTAPNDDGTNVTEPVGNGYARVAVTNNVTQWPNASGITKTHQNAIAFAQATGSWGTLTHFVHYDAITAGNMLGSGTLDQAKIIDSGDTAEFDAGDLTIVLD